MPLPSSAMALQKSVAVPWITGTVPVGVGAAAELVGVTEPDPGAALELLPEIDGVADWADCVPLPLEHPVAKSPRTAETVSAFVSSPATIVSLLVSATP